MFGKEVEAVRKKLVFLVFLKVLLLIYTNGLRKAEAKNNFCFSKPNRPNKMFEKVETLSLKLVFSNS